MMNAQGLSSVSGFDICTFNCDTKGNCGPRRACVSYKTLKPNTVTKLGQILLGNKSFCCLTTESWSCCSSAVWGWGCPGSLGCFSATSAEPRARVGVQGPENKTCNSPSATCQGSGLSRSKAGPSPSHLRRNLCFGARSASPLCHQKLQLQTPVLCAFLFQSCLAASALPLAGILQLQYI